MKNSVTFHLKVCSILLATWGVIGTTQTTVTKSSSPAERSKIAFVAGDATKRFDIFQINSDGSGLRLMTHDQSAFMEWNCCPAWSPNGKEIAFVSSDLPVSAKSRSAIFILDVVSGTARLLFRDDTGCLLDPAWSPRSKYLVFARGVKSRLNIGRFHQHRAEICTQTELFSMNLDGSGLRQLTHNETSASSRPAWSPDDGAIAYVSRPKSKVEGKADIFLMDPDGSKPRHLTQGGAAEVNADPSWSPDGTEIVFCSNRDGTDEVYVIGRDGNNVRELTHGAPGGAVHPSWSPDGQQIVFGAGDARAISIMNADGTGVRLLEKFAWRPDFGRVAAP